MSDPSAGPPPIPEQPIDRLVEAFERFMHVEASSGVVLLAATALALVLANSGLAEGFEAFWRTPVQIAFGSLSMSHSLQHWINDGLMAIFFFVIGLEVKRELVVGELRDLRQAALPIAGAIGGMVVPAGIYLALQSGEPTASGWGIPMATDIAFVVGCMALLGPRVPRGFRVMLLSIAIADDIGAILVIAVGYTETIHLGALAAGVVGIGLIHGLTQFGVRSFLMYTILGIGVWLAFHESGVHATIAGVLLGLMTPARSHLSETVVGDVLARATEVVRGGLESQPRRAERLRRFRRATREVLSPLEYLETALHPWVAFAIMPLFALANAGVPFEVGYLSDPVAIAVAAGLVIGKPVGILGMSFLAIRSGLARLPSGVSWSALAGGGLLAGIGFTMALFIAGLALPEGQPLYAAKVGVLAASVLCAILGMMILIRVLPEAVEGQAS